MAWFHLRPLMPISGHYTLLCDTRDVIALHIHRKIAIFVSCRLSRDNQGPRSCMVFHGLNSVGPFSGPDKLHLDIYPNEQSFQL